MVDNIDEIRLTFDTDYIINKIYMIGCAHPPGKIQSYGSLAAILTPSRKKCYEGQIHAIPLEICLNDVEIFQVLGNDQKTIFVYSDVC